MKTQKSRVRLEPELEEDAALLTPPERRAMARKLERWARQLRLSATIMEIDDRPKPPPSLKPLPLRRLMLN